MRTVLIVGLVWLFIGGAAVEASTSDRACRQLFQTRQFVSAAQCFEGLLVLKASQPQKGVWLWNAALAYRQAANQTQRLSVASYFRENAVRLLTRYLDGKFYRLPSQRRVAEQQRERVKGLILYASLSLKVPSPTAQLVVRGYRYSRRFQGANTIQVRPGSYTVVFSLANNVQKVRLVHAPPGQQVSVTFADSPQTTPVSGPSSSPKKTLFLPPIPKSKPETLVPQQLMVNITPPPRTHGTVVASWFMIGLGVAGLAAGGAFIGLMVDSANKNNELVQKIDNPSLRLNGETVDRLEGERAVHKENYERYFAAGVGLGVAGAVLGIVGITIRAAGPRESVSPSSYSVSVSPRSSLSHTFFTTSTH
ncbi:MAG: hypothetical protein EP343_14170 [Deltaproteobacteria bacterium]|nr:MAG: hypothetical protein EP343_14170 [Deltaproteobacteria bacterium]